MHYDPRLRDHGLPHNPFTALVVPRPIGWISTLGPDGVVNLAPYSFFNAICGDPPMVMFSSVGRKHSLVNAETGGEFVVNLAGAALCEEMNITSAPVPAEVSEADLAGLEMAPSRVVAPPRVARAPAALECRHVQTLPLHDVDGNPARSTVVIGQVVGVYIDDAVIVDGIVRMDRVRPLSRLGYMDYAVVDNVFSMERPDL